MIDIIDEERPLQACERHIRIIESDIKSLENWKAYAVVKNRVDPEYMEYIGLLVEILESSRDKLMSWHNANDA